jgi:hypothetical protein
MQGDSRENMSKGAFWRLSSAELALPDVRLALSEVASKHDGVVFYRDGAARHEAGEAETRADGDESFMVGFPASMVRAHGDEPGSAPDADGLYWGKIVFSQGARGAAAGDVLGASMQTSPVVAGGSEPWETLSGFAEAVAAELGGALDGGDPREVPLTWTQVRAWLRRHEVQITEETDDYVSFVLNWDEDQRAQLVTLDRVERFQRPWLRITSGVCKLHQLTPEEALERNDTLVASLARDDLDYYLVHHVALGGLTLALLDTLIWDVGSEADMLEQELTGGLDEY